MGLLESILYGAPSEYDKFIAPEQRRSMQGERLNSLASALYKASGSGASLGQGISEGMSAYTNAGQATMQNDLVKQKYLDMQRQNSINSTISSALRPAQAGESPDIASFRESLNTLARQRGMPLDLLAAGAAYDPGEFIKSLYKDQTGLMGGGQAGRLAMLQLKVNTGTATEQDRQEWKALREAMEFSRPTYMQDPYGNMINTRSLGGGGMTPPVAAPQQPAAAPTQGGAPQAAPQRQPAPAPGISGGNVPPPPMPPIIDNLYDSFSQAQNAPSLLQLSGFRPPQIARTGAPNVDVAAAKGREEASIRYYNEKVLPNLEKTQQELSDIDTLKTINPATGAFEPVKGKLDNVLAGLGVSSGKKATNFAEANQIVQGFQLGKFKGEGAVSNFERGIAAAASPRLSDPQAAWNFSTSRIGTAKIKQALEGEVYQEAGNSGSYSNADAAYSNLVRNTPSLTRNPETGQVSWLYDFYRNYKAQNPDAPTAEILAKWNKNAKIWNKDKRNIQFSNRGGK